MRKVVHLYQRPNTGGMLVQFFITLTVTAGLALLFTYLGLALAALFTGEPILAFAGIDYATAPTNIITGLKILQVASVIGLFILPAILLPRFLFRTNPFYFTGLTKLSGLLVFIFALLSFFAFMPLLELSISINEKLKLPGGFEYIENMMRSSEDATNLLTRRFLEMPDFSSLLVNIFIVALLPAFAEELFFRGFLQRTFYTWWRNKHVAVWVTAFLFSFIHFQFYGFLPRFLLGAFLGYVFIYTRSLYVPMLIHFVNNFSSVMLAYISQKKGDFVDVNSATDYPQYLYFLSAVTGAFLFFLFYKQTRIKRPADDLNRTGNTENWAKVYVTTQAYEAEIVAGNLQSSGINAVVINKRDSSYQAFGEVEVHVPASDFEQAKALLSTYNL